MPRGASGDGSAHDRAARWCVALPGGGPAARGFGAAGPDRWGSPGDTSGWAGGVGAPPAGAPGATRGRGAPAVAPRLRTRELAGTHQLLSDVAHLAVGVHRRLCQHLEGMVGGEL